MKLKKYQEGSIIDPLFGIAGRIKREIPKVKQKVRNAFMSNHLTYTPELKEGDSYNNSIVIDKSRQHLYSYDQKGNLTFHTPVSTGMYEGSKQEKGDNKTPTGKHTINSYTNKADKRKFGTNDFWLLNTGFSGIGIHGDAGHPENIGLPDSHGCIRMPNDSIQCFQKKVRPKAGQTVYVLGEDGKYKLGGVLGFKSIVGL